jgi:hypothetical protein
MTTFPRTRIRARRGSDIPAAHALARAGLTARGIIYILLGWVALLVAPGHGSHEADQQGALQLLAGKPYGSVSLWLLGSGFVAYALWHLSEAAYGVVGEGNRAGARLRSLARAVIYAGLAYLTFKVISGTEGSQSRQQQDVTASLMQHPGGRWLVGIIGLIVVIVGLVLVMEGIRRRFMEYLRTSQMGPRMLRIVRLFGTAGTVLVIDAAVSHHPAASGGIDKALLSLRNQPAGPVLLVLATLGLVIFGVYGLREARWRRV